MDDADRNRTGIAQLTERLAFCCEAAGVCKFISDRRSVTGFTEFAAR